MSSSSSSSMTRKSPKKNKKIPKSSVHKQITLNSSSVKLGLATTTIIQTIPMNKNNINVSTGGTTYNNPTSSSTFFASASGNVTADPCFAAFFTLNDITQVNTLTSLYDQYRIREIEVIFTPLLNQQNEVTSAQQLNVPDYSLYYTLDFDDAAVVSPLVDLMEYEGIKRHDVLNKGPVKIKFKPHVAIAAYVASAFSSFANQSNEWIDCASPSVQHYGIKWGIPCPISATYAQPTFSTTCRYLIDFRTVR
jgi:hypothetical protein